VVGLHLSYAPLQPRFPLPQRSHVACINPNPNSNLNPNPNPTPTQPPTPGPKLVRELFRVADEMAPSIVFMGARGLMFHVECFGGWGGGSLAALLSCSTLGPQIKPGGSCTPALNCASPQRLIPASRPIASTHKPSHTSLTPPAPPTPTPPQPHNPTP